MSNNWALEAISWRSIGEPRNLITQIAILSLANQNQIKSLAIKELEALIKLYLSLPFWALLYLPPRILAKAITTCISS